MFHSSKNENPTLGLKRQTSKNQRFAQKDMFGNSLNVNGAMLNNHRQSRKTTRSVNNTKMTSKSKGRNDLKATMAQETFQTITMQNQANLDFNIQQINDKIQQLKLNQSSKGNIKNNFDSTQMQRQQVRNNFLADNFQGLDSQPSDFDFKRNLRMVKIQQKMNF